MERREFLKTGSVMLVGLGTAKMSLSFVPDNFYSLGDQPYLPFRKLPREVKEVVPGFLWIDAADFADYGGWGLDTQFVSFMGSSYLIAHGTGRPVADAKLRVGIPRAGRYRIWVRSRNWDNFTSPGKFGLVVDGQVLPQSFGVAASDEWIWEDAGIHDFHAGKVQLALRDKTGEYGRCSNIVITRELDYRPPAELEAFRKERSRLTGISLEPEKAGDFDIVIVGAGSAGCCAALAAARLGARVAMISDRPVIGGNCSVENAVPIQGAAAHHVGKHMRESGLIEEAGRLGLANNWGYTLTRAFDTLVKAEPNITLFDDMRVYDVRMQDGAIREAYAFSTLYNTKHAFPAEIFIDATGDGWLGYHAGADFRLGREARSEHDESLAPEVADHLTMSGCLRGPSGNFRGGIFYKAVDKGSPVEFDPPEWIYPVTDPVEFATVRHGRNLNSEWRSGSWWLEHSNDMDDLWQGEKARDELLRVNFSMWNFVKNEWTNRQVASNFELEYVPFTNAKRETRRLLGDYILTQNDCEQATPFSDTIGHAGWTLDLHALDGFFDSGNPYYSDVWVPINNIPYRTLYSRNVSNLFMGGRCISVTHVALGTVRVQGQTALTGQAVGVAAVMALKHKTTPRGIYERHIPELQQWLLRTDQYIPGVINEDTADLARQATASASSVQTSGDMDASNLSSRQEDLLQVNTHRGVVMTWKEGDTLKSVSLRLKANANTSAQVVIQPIRAADDLTAAGNPIEISVNLRRGDEQWVEFATARRVSAPFALVYLKPNNDLQWRRVRVADSGTSRVYGAPGNWTVVGNELMAFQTDPKSGSGDTSAFAPANVINGIARPSETAANMWMSDANQTLPQWIELTWEKPISCNHVQCVFDTMLDCILPRSAARPAECVKDYTLLAWVDDEWKTLASVKNNFQRFCVHRFDSITTRNIRLIVEATNGVPSARVIEMRVYNDSGMII